jgi:hypothetical protein
MNLQAQRAPADRLAGPSKAGLGSLWIRGLELTAFGVLPLLLTAFLVRVSVTGGFFAVDFDHGPWVAGRRVFAGLTPYVGPSSPQLAHGSPFVYPAVAAFLLSPFSLLSRGPAGAVFAALSVAAVLLTLRVLRVSDWRVYGLVLAWPAVILGWQTANLTLLLGLGIALAWRYRDRPAVAGVLIALLISLKMFVWPLGLWLLATRRYAALGYATVVGVGINVVAWQALGLHQIGRYIRLMDALTRIQERRSYSLVALALGQGVPRPLAYGLSLGVAAIAGAACVALGRRGHDRPAFALSVATCLLATPIIWLHYFALLLIPLALARPKLSPILFAPLFLLFPASTPKPWQVLMTLIVAGIVTATSLKRLERSPGRSQIRLPLKPAGPQAETICVPDSRVYRTGAPVQATPRQRGA